MSDEARYQIRALGRALTILRVLNQHNGLNASDLSRLVDLPRPTVLRLLTTLGENGYVIRYAADHSFRASRKVRELSLGFRNDSRLNAVAREVLTELEQAVVWPLAVISMEDDVLYVEALTDHGSPFVPRRDSAGRDLPWLTGSAAHLYLAHAAPEDRKRLLERAFAKESAILAKSGLTPHDIVQLVEAAQTTGHALIHLPTYSSLSVPVLVQDRLVCALNLRMHASAEARHEKAAALIPQLQHGAAELSRRLMLPSTLH